MPKFASGGISSGPYSGYPVMLHGTEAVVPLNNGYIPVRVSNPSPNETADPEIKNLLKTLISMQAQDRYLSVDGRKFKVYVQEQADNVRIEANRRPGNDTRRIV